MFDHTANDPSAKGKPSPRRRCAQTSGSLVPAEVRMREAGGSCFGNEVLWEVSMIGWGRTQKLVDGSNKTSRCVVKPSKQGKARAVDFE